MTELIGWISMVVYISAIPSMAVLGIIFNKQRKTQGSLILASGLIAILIGMIMGFIFPQTFVTMEEAKQVITTTGAPLQWYIDDVIYIIGIIMILIGFWLVIYEDKKKCITNQRSQ